MSAHCPLAWCPLTNQDTTTHTADVMSTEESITLDTPATADPPHNATATEKVIAQTDNNTHEGRTITVALDMSERSRDAFAWTVANLYRAGDKLSLIHVSPEPDAYVVPDEYCDFSLMDTSNEDEKCESHKMLGRYSKYCFLHNITHEARHFIGDLGLVVGELTTKQAEGSTLIVGNHNKKSIENLFLGSSSESAVHSARVPVVIIKRPHKVSLDPDTKRRIGICVDSSEHARGAFDWIMKEMYRVEDSVFIVHMSGVSDVTIVDGVETGGGVVDKYVHLLAERSADYHTVHSRTHKPLSEAAASLADSMDLDCLVVGSRGQGAVKRTLFGSFSDGLVRACKCNVVVVKS